VDGLHTAYRRKGSGERILYLHGGGMTRMWLPLFEQLASDHDLIAPEHPGFGDTPLPDRFEDFNDYVLHYDGLLAALGLDPVHLVGHSLGGWIAAELAVFYPRRFKSLTLVTAAGLRVRGRIAAPGVDTFRLDPAEALEALVNGRADRYAEYFVQDGPPADIVSSYVEATTRALLTWNPRYDHKLDDRLPRVSMPTLVVGAEEDRIVPNAVAQRYVELIPDARLVTVGGTPNEPSSHILPVEHPSQVAALVRAHVAESS
jgi:pimeloyl-ACP methyl ester carboxylesterase